eukprot:00482.XXX_1868_2200_1 [CDS] Oithona nana genome sequencing.
MIQNQLNNFKIALVSLMTSMMKWSESLIISHIQFDVQFVINEMLDNVNMSSDAGNMKCSCSILVFNIKINVFSQEFNNFKVSISTSMMQDCITFEILSITIQIGFENKFN